MPWTLQRMGGITSITEVLGQRLIDLEIFCCSNAADIEEECGSKAMIKKIQTCSHKQSNLPSLSYCILGN